MARPIPSFSRVEIRLQSRADIERAVTGLRALAGKLETALNTMDGDGLLYAARVYALETSNKLRFGE